jgi:hypothetical protein
MANEFPDLSVEDFDFERLVKEVSDMLTGKTDATEKRAILYGEFYPNGVLLLPETGLTPENAPTQDYHIANKKYVDDTDSSYFFARIY